MRAYARYERPLWGIARKLTRHDPWLVADMFQEGCLCLRELVLHDVRRERSYVLQACKYAMIDALRRLQPDRYITFQEAHYLGYVFTHAPDGGMRAECCRAHRERPGRMPDWIAQVNA